MKWRWLHQRGNAVGLGLTVVCYVHPNYSWASILISARLGRHTLEVSGSYR